MEAKKTTRDRDVVGNDLNNFTDMLHKPTFWKTEILDAIAAERRGWKYYFWQCRLGAVVFDLETFHGLGRMGSLRRNGKGLCVTDDCAVMNANVAVSVDIQSMRGERDGNLDGLHRERGKGNFCRRTVRDRRWCDRIGKVQAEMVGRG